MTIAGIAADSTMVGGKGSLAGRRFVAMGAMLAGALVGAALVIRVCVVHLLLIALALVLMVAATAWLLGTSGAAWIRTTRERL